MERDGSSPRATPALRLEILDIDRLRSHEAVESGLLRQTIEEIRKDGCLKRPILVADGDNVILDGHHRFEALRTLGYRRIPAYVIDYSSDLVEVTTWPQATVKEVTKQEVLRRGRTGELFPPKTTRHILRTPLPEISMDLKDLR